MTHSETQTIEECLGATKTHSQWLRGALKLSLNKILDDIDDVILGMDITISKLENLLKKRRNNVRKQS